MPSLRSFITVGEVARLVGVSSASLRNWDTAGKPRAVCNLMSRHPLHRKADPETLLSRVQAPPSHDHQADAEAIAMPPAHSVTGESDGSR